MFVHAKGLVSQMLRLRERLPEQAVIHLERGAAGQIPETPIKAHPRHKVGIVDGGTIGRGRAMGIDAMASLQNNDANTYLAATGDLVVTGPTGTNVADLWFVLNRETRDV